MTKYEQAIERCRDRMPRALDVWIRELGLQEELAEILFTVTTWTKHCAFEDTSDVNRAIASLDLALWLFALDDYDRPDYEEFFSRCAAILEGRPRTPEPPLLRAFREVLERVASFGAPMDRFIADRHRLMRCYRRRNQARAGAPIGFEEYFEIRNTTVYVDHWIGIWEILDHFYLDDATRGLPEVQSLVADLKTWHILENEIESLERDLRDGTPNLVRLLAFETARSTKECVEELRVRRDDAAIRYRTTRAYFPAPSVGNPLARYVAFLDRSMRGGDGNYVDNQERYRAVESELASA